MFIHTFTRKHHRPQLLLAACLLLCSLSGENIIYPAASNVIDVTQAPYNAAGDGISDDTAALQQAIHDHIGENRILYLPNGTYLITDTLQWGDLSHKSHGKRLSIQGQSEAGTILKLANSAMGYTDSLAPKAMMTTGKAPAQRFGNNIRNLTFDTGTDNAGAIALQYNSSNYGFLERLTIRSGDGQGVIGLDLEHSHEIGPFLGRHITIDGFDQAIVTGDEVNSSTFEYLTIRNQNVRGIWNGSQVMNLRKVTSENSVTVYENGAAGVTTILESDFTGGSASVPAVINNSMGLYVRDLSTSGYSMSIENNRGGSANVTGTTVTEFSSHGMQSLFETNTMTLQLPIKETPELPWESDLNEWANVVDYGAVGDGTTDDTAAIQAAIDSGKSTVYLPADAKYIIDGTLEIRGDVERFLGTRAFVGGEGEVHFKDGNTPTVIIENIEWDSSTMIIRHQASRTLVIRSCEARSIIGEGTGDLFIDDVSDQPYRDKSGLRLLELNNPAQSVWCRQFNPENKREIKIVNNGAKLWIFGLKTENDEPVLETKNGGQTELIGAHIYAQGSVKETPMFIVTDADASFAGVRQFDWRGRHFTDIVQETRGSVTLVLDKSDTEVEGDSYYSLPAYSAIDDGTPQPASSAAPTNLMAVANLSDVVELSWTDNASSEHNHLVERKVDGTPNWVLLATLPRNTTSYTDTGLWDGVEYHYRVRTLGPGGFSAYTPEESVTTPTAVSNYFYFEAAYHSFSSPTATEWGYLNSSTVILRSENIGEAIEFDAFFPRGGDFDVFIEYKSHRDRGRGQLYFNGQTIGPVVDQYENTDNGSVIVAESGSISVASAGWHNFRLQVAGVHSQADLTLLSVQISGGSSDTPNPPEAPSSLSATEITPNQVDLSWTDNTVRELGFHVERRVLPDGDFVLMAELPIDVSSYSDVTTWDGVGYEYRVMAYNLDGDSLPSNVASITTTATGGATYRIELEKLSSVETAEINHFGGGSGTSVEKLNASVIGDYVEYDLPIDRAGTFDLSLHYKYFEDRGIARLSINGTDIAGDIDQYATTTGFSEASLSESVTFDKAGIYKLRFTVVGQHVDSGELHLTLDALDLAETSGPGDHNFTPPPPGSNPPPVDPPPPPPAPGTSTRGTTVLDENFDDGVANGFTLPSGISVVSQQLNLTGSDSTSQKTHTVTVPVSGMDASAQKDFTFTTTFVAPSTSFSGGTKVLELVLSAQGEYELAFEHIEETLYLRKNGVTQASATFERLRGNGASYAMELRGRYDSGSLSLTGTIAGNGTVPVAIQWSDTSPASNGEAYEYIVRQRNFNGSIDFDNLLLTDDSALPPPADTAIGTWLDGHGLDINDLLLDHDGDGLNNLHEYLAGTHPISSHDSLGQAASSDGLTRLSLTILSTHASLPDDLSYTLEGSDDLGNTDPWGTVTATVFSTDLGGGLYQYEFRQNAALNSGGKPFLRLKVSTL